MRLLVVLLVALLSAPRVSAEDAMPGSFMVKATAENCASSWPERFADFRESYSEAKGYRSEYARIMPWFKEHCRWLEDYEIAIRKINTAEAFACDTEKGRPRGMTLQFALAHQDEPSPTMFVKRMGANGVCSRFDYDAGRPVLEIYFGAAMAENVRDRRMLAAICWEVSSAECDRARETLAAQDAADPLPPPKHFKDR